MVHLQVAWLNNLERDKQYARYSRSAMDLLSMFPGRLRPLAKNIFHMVLVVDPLSPAGLAAGAAANRMYQRMFPVRFGVLPVVKDAVERVDLAKRFPSRTFDAPEWQVRGVFVLVRCAWFASTEHMCQCVQCAMEHH